MVGFDSPKGKQVPQEGEGEDKLGAGKAPPAGGPGSGLAAGEVGRLPRGGPVLTGALCLCDLHLLQAGRHPRWHARAWLSWGEHARAHVGPALCRQPGSPVLPPQLFAENWVGSVV